METPLQIIRTQEQNYISNSTQISEYVSFSPKTTIDKIEAYLNSTHISGSTDSLGREKPFFNIVTGATNIWYRATDIDLPATYNESYSFNFTIPKGLKLIFPVNKTTVENSIGLCSIELAESDGKVTLTRKISINKAIIPVANKYAPYMVNI